MNNDEYQDQDHFDKVLNKLVEVSGQVGVETSRYETLLTEFREAEDELAKTEKANDWFQEIANKETKRADDEEKKFRTFHKGLLDFIQTKEAPFAKEILKTILIIMLKDGVFPLDNKKAVITFLRVYNHITGEKLPACKKAIDDIINNIDNIIVTEVEVSDVKTVIKDIKDGSFNESEISTDPAMSTSPLSSSKPSSVYKQLIDAQAAHDKTTIPSAADDKTIPPLYDPSNTFGELDNEYDPDGLDLDNLDDLSLKTKGLLP